MAEHDSSTIVRVVVGIVLTFILSIAASIIGWLVFQVGDLRTKHEETDRTQDVVLQRLNTIETTLSQLPVHIDIRADDRWTGAMQDLYVKPIEMRLQRLESFHPPYNKHR